MRTPDEPGFDEADQLDIDPEECIDCDACVEACPVDAIASEDQVPPEWRHYIQRNAAYYGQGRRANRWPCPWLARRLWGAIHPKRESRAANRLPSPIPRVPAAENHR